MTCYPDLEPDVRAAGAEFVNRDVVVDGTLVTVRGWPDNGPWMREFVRAHEAAHRSESDGSCMSRTSRVRSQSTAESVIDVIKLVCDRGRHEIGLERPWCPGPATRAWF